MKSVEIQYITEGLQVDKAGLSTKIQSQMDKKNDFYVRAGMSLASHVASSTSRALFWMKWSKKECFSIALRHTLVVLEMHGASMHF